MDYREYRDRTWKAKHWYVTDHNVTVLFGRALHVQQLSRCVHITDLIEEDRAEWRK